jgi:riboflavin kinase/FMN adenylyltransferase
MSPDEKAEKLHALGVDYVVTLAFNDELRHIRAAEFVASLVARLKLSSLWVGADFAMGYKREGNVAFLQKQGDEKDFTLHVIGLIPDEERVISSTNIRTALQTGDVAQARDWLGRAYTTKGEVVHGEKRGRKIGFPTANVDVWNEQVIPANGVYAGWAYLNGERFMAVTNVGVRPTFAGDDVTVEAHLLDFERDIYGEQLEVTFETRLRAEQRFDGIEALVAQINRDVEAGREYLMQRA